MPESAAQAAVRDRLARAAERRRSAITALRLAESACRYGADQIGNGLGPGEALAAARAVADELIAVAVVLRRLTPLEPGERREAAVALARLGIPRREIADRLGLTQGTVRKYLRPRSHGR
jgi:DNA-binding NarL/FixJ family response regulator